MRKLFVIFLLGCVWVSCRSHESYILSPDSMKVVMWDLLKIDEVYTRMVVKDTTLRQKKENIRLYEEVFALHHITRKQFDSSYRYYEAHPIEFKALLDSVDALSLRERNHPDRPLPAAN